MSQTITDLIEQYEIPQEYVEAMFKAYELGGLRFMEITIEQEIKRIATVSV